MTIFYTIAKNKTQASAWYAKYLVSSHSTNTRRAPIARLSEQIFPHLHGFHDVSFQNHPYEFIRVNK